MTRRSEKCERILRVLKNNGFCSEKSGKKIRIYPVNFNVEYPLFQGKPMPLINLYPDGTINFLAYRHLISSEREIIVGYQEKIRVYLGMR